MKPKNATTTKKKATAKTKQTQVETHADASRSEIGEAARILKSGTSKKRERRRAAAVMSQSGSRKGGLNRAQNLSPEKLKEIATLGGLARQAKAREQKEIASQKSNARLLTDAAA